MGMGKKLAIGAASFVPAIALGVAIYGLTNDDGAAFTLGLIVSGFADTALAVIFIPHVYDSRRIGKDWKIVWIALLGIPYITVAPIYWLIYMLPEKEPPPKPTPEELGGAWYADPWGQAPFRWWDGQRWTDWVTGPPGGG
jgi:hypothetical protein